MESWVIVLLWIGVVVNGVGAVWHWLTLRRLWQYQRDECARWAQIELAQKAKWVKEWEVLRPEGGAGPPPGGD